LMIQMKTNRAQLAGLTADTFNDLVDYILGEDVAGLEAKDPEGRVMGRPSWAQVLSYEFNIRKQAYRWFNEKGMALDTAIQTAMEDQEIKSKFLTTPMAVSVAAIQVRASSEAGTSANSRSWAAAAQVEGRWAAEMNTQPPNNWQARPPKKPTGPPASRTEFHNARVWQTTDGRPICRKFGNDKCSDDKACGMLHVCDYCAGSGHGTPNHPASQCPHRPAPVAPDAAREAFVAKKGKGKGKKGGKSKKGKWWS